MKTAKILICAHKPFKLYQDEVYTPIQVGKSTTDIDLGYIGDDTGDNISEKNPYYCELTAQYWAWKNLTCDFIGLEHYRRHFLCRFSLDKLDQLMKNVDVVLAAPKYLQSSVWFYLERYLTLEDVFIFYKILIGKEVDKKIVDRYLSGNMDIRFNMFFMKKELFDEFAQWQFDILGECEKYIKKGSYTRLRRIYGYFGEVLLPIWCLQKGLKFKYLPIDLPETNWNDWQYMQKLRYRLSQKFYKSFFWLKRCFSTPGIVLNQAALVGLEQDGIKIE